MGRNSLSRTVQVKHPVSGKWWLISQETGRIVKINRRQFQGVPVKELRYRSPLYQDNDVEQGTFIDQET